MAAWWEPYEKPAEDTPSKSPWRSFVDSLTNRDWGNTEEVFSQGVQKGLTGLIQQGEDFANPLNYALPDTPIAGAIRRHIGPDKVPQDKADEYVGAVGAGLGASAPFLPLAPVAAILGGIGSGVGGQGAHDIFPNSEVAPVIGSLVGGLVGGVGGGAGRSIRTGALIRTGMQHPDFQALVDNAILPNEGGGSLEHPKVNAKSGATGPMQVTPETARDPGYGIRPWDGKSQADLARVGQQKFAVMLAKYNDPEKALAAYNWGEGNLNKAVAKYGDAWYDHAPEETQNYVYKGMTKVYGGPELYGPAGPDGLPTNGSVPPIDPNILATIMKDPEAAGLNPNYEPGQLGNFEIDPNVPIEHTPENELMLSNIESNRLRNQIKSSDNIVEFPNKTSERENLTPAERQEMDASAPKPNPVEAVDARTIGQGADYPEQIAANNERVQEQPPKPPQEPPQEPPTGGGGDSGSPDGRDPEEKLIEAINNVRPASIETKDLVSQVKKNQAKKLQQLQARGADLPEQLASLKGELPSADYESVADQFTDQDKKALQEKINKSLALSPFDKTNTLTALNKLLSDQGMKIPTSHELDMLADVFSPKLIKALVDRQTGNASALQKIANIGGIPRTIMSSTDISAPGRQGIMMIGRKEFWSNYPKMIKMMFNPKFYDAQMQAIKEDPNYGLMRQGNLAVRDSVLLKDREEYFVSNMAEHMPGEKIPGIGLLSKAYNKTVGAVVRASDRAYTGFLRKLRADVFNTIIEKGRDAGIDWESNPNKLKALGRFVNTATGRGDLGKFEEASQAFSTIFFAPRLVKARFDTLVNPAYYTQLYKADPMIANEAAKALLSFSAIAATVLGLAVAGGAKVEGDIRSADGWKIKIGDTRVDILGGFQQYLRLITQESTGTSKTQSGNIKSLTSGKFGQSTRWDTLMNFAADKLAPVPGVGRDYLKGKNPSGHEFTWSNELSQIARPMDISDVVDSLKQDGPKGAWVALPAILGAGVQTYAPYESKSKSHGKGWWKAFEPSQGPISAPKQKDWWKEYENK